MLDTRTRTWRAHSSLASPRSQAASAVVGDSLVLLSGYSDSEEDWALASLQRVGVTGPAREQQLRKRGGAVPYSSRLALAVTLASGSLLVTGGMSKERDVFLVSGSALEDWQPRRRMIHGRLGHAGARLVVGGEEQVAVAGGWDTAGLAQASVEVYSVRRDSWHLVQALPQPRVEFMLRVGPPPHLVSNPDLYRWWAPG